MNPGLPKITPLKRVPHIFEPTVSYRDTKDPVVVQDESTGIWHMYGSGGSSLNEQWEVLHATAPSIEGPWTQTSPAVLNGVQGNRFCAPGILYDNEEKLFHMFIHTDCFANHNTVEHLVSSDGFTFTYLETPLTSIPFSREVGIYDPHPVVISNAHGQKEYYFTYSGFPDVAYEKNRADIYLAKSTTNSWNGPWIRLGTILRQEEVSHHNQQHSNDYEWGLEGAQLLQLPNKKILLNAVCFLPQGKRGTRQRVFFAIAEKITGPYKTLGPILDPLPHPTESGENGHAAGCIKDGQLHLFYQSRPFDNDPKWRYGLATFDHAAFEGL